MRNPLQTAMGIGLTVMVTTAALSTSARADGAANVLDTKPDSAEVAIPVRDLALAQRLAQYGLANADAVALIAAARIMGRYAVQDRAMQPRDPDGSAPPQEAHSMASATSILAAARSLAAGRADLIAMIDDAEAEGSRGTRGLGYYYYEDHVVPDRTMVYDEVFFGEEPAIINLNAWADTDLDLYIYDEFGNLICRSATLKAAELCEWTPNWTGVFTVIVRNAGDSATRFSLWTN